MPTQLQVVETPESTPDYAFREDYVSGWTKLWAQFMEPFCGKQHVTFLEIGSFEGRSAIWFLENVLTHPTSKIVCLDCFESGMEEAFDRNIAACIARDRVTKVKETSDSYLARVINSGLSFDIIYVDGAHDTVNVLFDGMAGWSLLKPGGVMVFDDYGWEPDYAPHRRPRMAIDLFLEARGSELDILHKDYQVIVRKLERPKTIG